MGFLDGPERNFRRSFASRNQVFRECYIYEAYSHIKVSDTSLLIFVEPTLPVCSQKT